MYAYNVRSIRLLREYSVSAINNRDRTTRLRGFVTAPETRLNIVCGTNAETPYPPFGAGALLTRHTTGAM